VGWGEEIGKCGSPDDVGTPDVVAGEEPSANVKDRRIRGFICKVKSRFGWLNNNWAVGILTGVISGALVAFFLSSTGQATLTATRDGFAAPTCSNPQWLLQVPDNQIFSSAYYVQADSIPGYDEYHSPGNTIDGNLETSWLQAWPSLTTNMGRKSSDYIEWSFSQPRNVRLICIVDGWSENSTTYKRTLPIGTATTYVTNSEIPPHDGSPQPSGTCSGSTTRFKDYLGRRGLMGFAYQWQPIGFRCVTDNIVLHIDQVSKSSMLNRPNLALHQLDGKVSPLVGLSEVRFYYCPAFLCAL
jgi:hypothetical protein